ncbi:MAG: class B sortase [Clostridia bacterium]|nr:class B sortase [Clostridia bacterium]
MKKTRKVIFIILEIIFVLLTIYSLYNIYQWYTENRKTSEILQSISNSITVDEDNKTVVDFDRLEENNSDIIAYIKVNGTEINYPVVKADDNDYYLSHSLDKTVNGAGWIFADYRNKLDGTDKNLIIYGHNRRDGSMFGTLKNILNKEWYEDKNNLKISLHTENEESTYEVFSVYQLEEEDYYLQTSFKDKEFLSFVNTLQGRSIKNFNVEVLDHDSILTLSTCANDNRYRVVLHAKKI